MARYDFRSCRLFVDAPLAAGERIVLDRGQANYLVNAMRLAAGDAVLLFNGRDGEWRADLSVASRSGNPVSTSTAAPWRDRKSVV